MYKTNLIIIINDSIRKSEKKVCSGIFSFIITAKQQVKKYDNNFGFFHDGYNTHSVKNKMLRQPMFAVFLYRKSPRGFS